MAPNKLNRLSAKRINLKNSISRFEEFLAEIEADSSKIVTLPYRLARFENLLDDFNNVQTEIEELLDIEDPIVLSENKDERQGFEDTFFNLLVKAKALIPPEADHISNGSVLSNNSSSQRNPSKNVRLPKISLPTFSGDPNTWSSFFDRFKSLIHDDNNLSISEKFFYLQSALTGDAAKLIEDLESTDINYEIAWTLLKERFEDSKNLIRSHIQFILDLPILTKENYSGLRNFLDTLLKNLRALKNLGEPVDKWDTLLLYLLVDKLDKTTKREWETETNKTKSPTIDAFVEFLKQRCNILKGLIDVNTTSVQNKSVLKVNKVQSHSSTEKVLKNCNFCNDSDHVIYYCKKFLELNRQDRVDFIKKIKACTNCLRKGHLSASCRSFTCKICNKKHNVLLHLKDTDKNKKTSNPSDNSVDVEINQGIKNVSDSLSMTSIASLSNSFVFLSTAVVYIMDKENNPIKCRALLDSGSQSSFITLELAKRLKLPTKSVNISILGTNAVNAAKVNKSINAKVQSIDLSYDFELPFLVIKTITDNVPQYDISTNINIPKNLQLADPEFHRSSKIDILLGCNIFYDILLNNKIKLGEGLPILQESNFGWIVCGPCSMENNSSLCLTTILKIDVQNQLEKFWHFEEIASNKSDIKYSEEETLCEDHFVQNYYRQFDGRFGVKLPFKEDVVSLGDSKDIAIKRYINLERKLNLNPELKKDYSKFINDYLHLGHMSLISLRKNDFENYYLPHHCVIKFDSLTTKVRVVFDGSCRTSSGKSLNDLLCVGPKIQEDIFNILLRFRKHKVGFTADIEKMYRQILVHPDDRKFQRILWRENSGDNLNHFELNTVTYGLGPSSFLATRCLLQLSIENENNLPKASEAIRRDFYMDDLICGCDTEEHASILISEIIKILDSGKFPLRQWLSNKPHIFKDLNIKSDSSQFLIKDTNNSKTLGILWQSSEDVFSYSVNKKEIKVLTKRIVLSIISQIFDPLGLISPVIILAKILLQKLWSLKLEWDDTLPKNYTEDFLEFYNNISDINKIKIPRFMLLPKSERVELHCFSDASQVAYGACIYLLSKNSSGKILTRLACSKSRVSPLKPMTLPRLELSAALLSAQLFAKTIESLYISVSRTTFWCDSTIVLAWINHDPSKLKTFVANRVTQIKDLTKNNQWKYVPTKENPADLVSRGVDPSKLLSSSIWWNGPSFLGDEENWPLHPSEIVLIPETKELVSCSSLTRIDDFSILTKYSTYPKLLRIVSYVFRFYLNCKNSPSKRKYGLISKYEIDVSRIALIKLSQCFSFKDEIERLSRSRQISKNSKILSLSPFLDSEGILRVGGRISESFLEYDRKHPILLSPNCNFTNLVIKYEHEISLHAGTQIVLCNLRNHYWIIKGRQNVKKIIRKCIKCFKACPKNIVQKMADLPAPRVTPSRAFQTVGIDYAGPYLIKDSKLRNKKFIKSYLCIFVCFSSKSVHIELVSDLTAEGFLNALKRFISRRGLCRHIYSDNATYFVKAAKELKDFAGFCEDKLIQNYLCMNQITWHFIPPFSPHMGGLWERTVRSVKFHIKRILNETYLTYEEFYTLLSQIECILNSRPLIPLTEDPEDMEALTPGHLICGAPLQALPEPVAPDNTKITTSRYNHLKLMLQHFWNRWSKEYLSSLQQRAKWASNQENKIKPGVLVLLKEDHVSPMKWKLARITAVHPGKDGIVRVVSLKTEHGETKRSVHKVCVLPNEL